MPQQPSATGLNQRLEMLVDQLIDELLRLRGALQFMNQKQ